VLVSHQVAATRSNRSGGSRNSAGRTGHLLSRWLQPLGNRRSDRRRDLVRQVHWARAATPPKASRSRSSRTVMRRASRSWIVTLGRGDTTVGAPGPADAECRMSGEQQLPERCPDPHVVVSRFRRQRQDEGRLGQSCSLGDRRPVHVVDSVRSSAMATGLPWYEDSPNTSS
jgi:hypothetical protein